MGMATIFYLFVICLGQSKMHKKFREEFSQRSITLNDGNMLVCYKTSSSLPDETHTCTHTHTHIHTHTHTHTYIYIHTHTHTHTHTHIYMCVCVFQFNCKSGSYCDRYLWKLTRLEYTTEKLRILLICEILIKALTALIVSECRLGKWF